MADPISTPSFDWRDCRVIVTGGAGFLGRNVCEVLLARGVSADRLKVVRSASCDLTDQRATHDLLREPISGAPADVVIHCAGRVGGLGANRARPGAFFFENAAMALNLVEGARRAGFIERHGKLVMVGSMTSYPAGAPVPFKEADLFSGYPESDIAAYGIAKRAAWQALDAYHREYGLQSSYLIPVNLYGPGDNLDPATSHFVGALVDRCVVAKRRGAPSITCWGSGTPTRQFLFIKDAAEAVVLAAERMNDPRPINLGSAEERSIRETTHLIARLAGYEGRIDWDATKPDGMGRRALDTTRARELLGWTAPTSLEEGLQQAIAWRESLP